MKEICYYSDLQFSKKLLIISILEDHFTRIIIELKIIHLTLKFSLIMSNVSFNLLLPQVLCTVSIPLNLDSLHESLSMKILIL